MNIEPVPDYGESVRYIIEVPDFDEEMLNRPSPVPTEQYAHFFAIRQPRAESKGWASTAMDVMSSVGAVTSAGAAVSTYGLSWVAGAVIARGVLGGQLSAAVNQKLHAYYTKSTRVPVGHERVAAALATLKVMELADNASDLIQRINNVYTASYWSSSGSSWELSQALQDTGPIGRKYRLISSYLDRRALKEGMGAVHYNNGKRLFRVILALVEQSKVNVFHLEPINEDSAKT